MSLESDLVAALEAASGVTNLVSTRIYPLRLPDGAALPAIVYRRISTMYVLASGNTPMKRARIQIDVWSDRYLQTLDVEDAIHTALDYASPTGLKAIFPEDADDDYDEEADLYRRRGDYFIWRDN